MIEDSNDCIEFWREARAKIDKFKKLDDQCLVFGANTRGIGHFYEVFPLVTDLEIEAFEQEHQLELPLQYKTYLQTFGAGGAGPNYGIVDFRQHVSPGNYSETFPYTEEVWYDDMDDDQPIWDYPGLAYLGTAGCGTEYMIEFRGSNPGRLWVNWQEACTNAGSMIEYYQMWIDKVEPGLERFHRLRALANSRDNLSFEAVVKQMQCEPRESTYKGGRDWITEDEIMVHFEGTLGGVIVNQRRELLRFRLDNVGQIS